MNRRSFLQKAATCAAVAAVAPAPVPQSVLSAQPCALNLDAMLSNLYAIKRSREAAVADKSVDVIHLGPFDPEFRDKLESAMRRYQSIHPDGICI